MKLLYLTEFYPLAGEAFTGGVEARAHHVTTALAARHDVTVVTSRREEEPSEVSAGGVRIIRVGPAYPYSNDGHVFARLAWAISALRAGRRVDAELVEGTSFLAYVPAALIGLLKQIPRIATYHECWIGEWIERKGVLTGSLGGLWERLALRLRWTRLISVSEFTKRALLGAGVAEETIEVVPNGIDSSLFGPREAKDEKATIVCVSRLVETKRVDLLIRAVPSVLEAIPDMRVQIVGAGPERASLERLADELKVSDSVSFRGRVERNAEVLSTIRRAHAFALPSESEGFGIVLLEALASGVPVVCSDIPPLREVTAGKGAVLFRPGDPTDLAEKLIALLTDHAAYERKRDEAVNRARLFEWPRIVDRIESIYERAVGSAATRDH